ncbi:protein D3-like [Episyrphus balteatus]|uniref:protein D3-like n=1 Tax=Episyrphus balteatus TaxID=286459 RepID=UPI0024854D6D|nr:protein D3-like [Episyrphus balteatus]
MDAHNIVPDVIDAASVPKQIAKVTFPSGAVVETGKELTPTQAKDIPNVTWEADPNGVYALIMVDPDFPSPADPKLRELLLWAVINIPGNDLSKGQTLAEYVGVGPMKDTGLHRYIIWVFKMKAHWPTDRFISKTTREGRPNTKTRDYIEKFHMGNPIAGNYFTAQYDAHVDVILAGISGGQK